MADKTNQSKKLKTDSDDNPPTAQSDMAASIDGNPNRELTHKEKVIIASITRLPDMNIPEDIRSPEDDKELTPEAVPLEDCEMPKRHKKKKGHKD